MVELHKDTGWVSWIIMVVITGIAALWGQADGWLKALFFLAFLDIVAALIVAMSPSVPNQSLNLDTLRRGAQKKAMTAILVTASLVVQVYVVEETGWGVPLTTAVAGYYASLEFLSIMKHANAMGLSIPDFLLEAGTKFDKMVGGALGLPPRNRPEGGSTA